MEIETKHLMIRNFKLEDEADLCEYMLQRVNANFEAYPDFTAEKSRQEIEFRSKSDEFLAIELKSNHKVIGNIYIGKRDFNSRELGYVLNEKYQRKGYGSEAAKAVVDYYFTQGVHRIYAETCPDNIASWKTMEKIGMEREAHLKKNVLFHNDAQGKPIYWDTYIYACLEKNDSINLD